MKVELTKERKILITVGALLLVLGAVYRFYPQLEQLRAGGEDITIKQQKVVKYRRLVKNKESLEARRFALQKSLVKAELSLLRGDTPALAAVDIQNIIKNIADHNGVSIKSANVKKPQENEENTYLGISVEFTLISDIRQLKSILYQIESSEKFLRIHSMETSAHSPKQRELIRTVVTVEGFIRKPPETKKSGGSKRTG